MPPDRLSLLKCHDRIRPKTRRSIKKVDTGYKKIETTYKRRAFLLCYLTAFFAAANDENDTGQKSVWKTQKRLIISVPKRQNVGFDIWVLIWGVLRFFFTCLCRRMCLTHTHVAFLIDRSSKEKRQWLILKVNETSIEKSESKAGLKNIFPATPVPGFAKS